MVDPALLCMGTPKTCGFAGRCDTRGRCCRTVCAGSSSADLFPVANQPRDGMSIDSVRMPWSPGKLEQQWSMTSKTGQISVESLALPDPFSQVSTPSTSLYQSTSNLDIRLEDKTNINRFTHVPLSHAVYILVRPSKIKKIVFVTKFVRAPVCAQCTILIDPLFMVYSLLLFFSCFLI